MQEELFEDIDSTQSFTQEYLGLSLTKFLVLIVVVLIFGVYLGVIFYGTNSLEILFGLQEYEVYLHDEVYKLKQENAELQREYFELKEISAQ
ncbi:hypothetical protein JHD48_08145 [Sulfurimonas sp. SAG-AH-194-I05]|nr:hypothetical protein [Sulfurimonas sp. SAG-AH-194-I05]MDF1875703.1 hypothetical protein [Sulfurimonas sp. SAG-AH-194-I05]